MLTKLRYFLELIAVKSLFILFSILGIKNSGNFGSLITRFIGKKIAVNNLARNNLKAALPNLQKLQINQIINDMWDNLGRIGAEFTHICKLSQKELVKYITIDKKTANNINHIKKHYNGGIIISAHIGNWEIGPKFFLHHGIKVKSIYRELNNSMVNDITAKARNIDLIAKNSQGNKQIITELKKGNYIIIMVDQKITGGLDIPFFHKNALTSPSPAKLALKYNVPLIPTRIIRDGKKFKFNIEIDNIIEPEKEGENNSKTILKITKKLNKIVESWIRQYPSQWFWVHDRWKR
jgi:Kdo2-lipid IVA lauroyltransferase/acyltransferase